MYFCSARHMVNDFCSSSVAKGRTAKYKFSEAKQLILPHILSPTLFCSQVIKELLSSNLSALTRILPKYLDQYTQLGWKTSYHSTQLYFIFYNGEKCIVNKSSKEERLFYFLLLGLGMGIREAMFPTLLVATSLCHWILNLTDGNNFLNYSRPIHVLPPQQSFTWSFSPSLIL